MNTLHSDKESDDEIATESADEHLFIESGLTYELYEQQEWPDESVDTNHINHLRNTMRINEKECKTEKNEMEEEIFVESIDCKDVECSNQNALVNKNFETEEEKCYTEEFVEDDPRETNACESSPSKRQSVKGKRKPSLKCAECDYETNKRSKLTTHLFIHSETKLFKCSECAYETNRKYHLIAHLSIHSDTKFFKCSKCKYKTNRSSDLKTHLLIHSDTKKYKCSECDYETNYKSRFTTHVLNHSNVKLFKCFQCTYETNNKGHLSAHLMIHSDTKLLKCSKCDYRTNRKGDLNTHLIVHLDTKSFKCTECDYETNRKKVLRTHILNHADGRL